MPAMDLARIGFSSACLPGRGLAEAAQVGIDLGFQAYEMLAFDGYCHSQGLLRGFYYDQMTAAERETLRAVASRFRHLSTHAPFMDVPTVSPNPAMRAAARRQLEVSIEAVAYLGGSTTTTHVIPKQIHPFPSFRQEVVDLYRHLGDLAARLGVTVTIETGYPLAVDEFADLVRAINHPAVGANVDVGHLVGLIPREQRGTPEGVARYNDLLEAHLRSLGDKLYHFHLHDVRYSDFRDHRGAGRGIIDYGRLFGVVRQLGYGGLFVFELEEPDTVEALAESRRHIIGAAGLL